MVLLIDKTNEFRLYTDASNRSVCSIYYSGAYHDNTATTAITESNWTHILCVYDGANLVTYHNGVPVSTTAYTSSVTASSSILYIGQSSSNTQHYEGLVDDITLFNYQLNPNQVKLWSTHQGSSVAF
jgi:hypothetical protein